MIDNSRVIVTKRRYIGLKTAMIIFLFAVEFFAVMWGNVENHNGMDFWFAFAGYVLFLVLYMGKNNSSKVYLRYEFILGFVIKCMTANVVVTMFAIAVFENVGIKKIILEMLLLTAINIVSIVFVFCIINLYTNIMCPDAAHILHVYKDSITPDNDDDKDPLMKIKQEIEEYEYVYLHDLPLRWRKRLMKYCYEKNKTVFCTVNLSDVILTASGLAQDADTPVYYCSSYGIGGGSALIKRIFDFVCSLIALIVLSPIFAVVAIAIKLDDGGSVIYKQVRCTKDMKEFTIYKFRSMVEDSEADGVQFAVQNDKRLTRVGAILRKSKLDELPQLINIIKGDMSIVGPRPERPEFIKEAIKMTPEFVLRTKVKAGLTGYAQVRGYYNTSFRDKLLWDLMYIEKFSLVLDLKIIIMTILTLFSENMRDEEDK